jgi:purine catabolism regulator
MTPGATVAALVAGHEPGLRMAAGAGGAGRRIGSVDIASTVDTAALFPDALLFAGFDLAEAGWRADVLLRRAHEAGVAGLVVPDDGSLADATCALADHLRFPVLGTTRDVLAAALAVQRWIAVPEIDRAAMVLAAHRDLAGRAGSPEDVVAVLSKLSGVDVTVQDGGGRALAGAPSLSDGDFGGTAVPVTGDVAAPAMWVTARLPTTDSERERTVRDLLTVGAGALQRWAATRRVELEHDARVRGGLLSELLQLDDDPSDAFRRRTLELGWQIDGWHVGFHIRTFATTDLVGATPDVATVLHRQGLQPVLVETVDGWSGWCTSPSHYGITEVRGLVHRFRQVQRSLATQLSTSLGLGSVEPGPLGIAASIRAATDAARVAQARPQTGRFLHVDQLGAAQLLLATTRTEAFVPRARDLLQPLREHGGSLLETLLAYLDSGSHALETAAVLGVHRNTVTTRLARISSVLGVDLEEPDTRLALHLACRALAAEQD